MLCLILDIWLRADTNKLWCSIDEGWMGIGTHAAMAKEVYRSLGRHCGNRGVLGRMECCNELCYRLEE